MNENLFQETTMGLMHSLSYYQQFIYLKQGKQQILKIDLIWKWSSK